MSLPTWQSAYVFLIESPSAGDLLDGRSEGRTLSSFLDLAGIPTVYNLAVSKDAFAEAITSRLLAKTLELSQPPIIHISAHGNRSGIELSNRDFLAWTELADWLRPFNDGLQGELLVCLSACQGAAAGGMAFNDIKPLPMHTLVSTTGKPTWQDGAAAFVTLYHHLIHLRSTIKVAVDAMKVASGHDNFRSTNASVMSQVYSASLPLKQGKVAEALAALKKLRHGAGN